jgi:HEAT repeat protein
MANLPPEDQPDTVSIGPVEGIPVHYEDDPRLEAEHRRWSVARRKAQAMHVVDELLRGLHDDDWRVRHEVVDRLVARGKDDPRTLPELLTAGEEDRALKVREAVLLRLSEFDRELDLPVLHEAADDPQSEVRWAASHSLNQLGEQWDLDERAD